MGVGSVGLWIQHTSMRLVCIAVVRGGASPECCGRAHSLGSARAVQCPRPDFRAAGGNINEDYNRSAGSAFGDTRVPDSPKTDPEPRSRHLLARESAFTPMSLAKFCVAGTQPFAILARAFMALTARRSTNDTRSLNLRSNTGLGTASHERLVTPQSVNAVILWQGVIESPDDKIRVQPDPDRMARRGRETRASFGDLL